MPKVAAAIQTEVKAIAGSDSGRRIPLMLLADSWNCVEACVKKFINICRRTKLWVRYNVVEDVADVCDL
jgi:hypothetical protein